MGIEVEFGRVDYSGSPEDFRAWQIYGERVKGFIGEGGIGFGGGVASSRSQLETGESVSAFGVQIGVGMCPFLVSGGYNEGTVKPSR